MIKIYTSTLNTALVNEKSQDDLLGNDGLSEDNFYESLKPALDELRKEPSAETIQKILNFSKSL
jgi:hypothetical protein